MAELKIEGITLLPPEVVWVRLNSVDCPLCLVTAGQQCLPREDDRGRIHIERIFAARRKAKELAKARKSMEYTEKQIEEHLEKYGCFCGGYGTYTDYNCGAEFEIMCPHCSGDGKKKCGCKQPSLKCQR